MFGIAAIGILAALAGLFGYAATRPDTFVIRRDTLIPAPPERIFPLINDFREWRKWSPWESLDHDLQREYQGPDRGVGAAYSWEGKKAGAGRIKITESTPSRILIDLNFTKPWKASNTTEFTLVPTPEGTRVTWSMSGRNALMGKAMGIFVSMDRLVGKDFEAGLAKMKEAAETGGAPATDV